MSARAAAVAGTVVVGGDVGGVVVDPRPRPRWRRAGPPRGRPSRSRSVLVTAPTCSDGTDRTGRGVWQHHLGGSIGVVLARSALPLSTRPTLGRRRSRRRVGDAQPIGSRRERRRPHDPPGDRPVAVGGGSAAAPSSTCSAGGRPTRATWPRSPIRSAPATVGRSPGRWSRPGAPGWSSRPGVVGRCGTWRSAPRPDACSPRSGAAGCDPSPSPAIGTAHRAIRSTSGARRRSIPIWNNIGGVTPISAGEAPPTPALVLLSFGPATGYELKLRPIARCGSSSTPRR